MSRSRRQKKSYPPGTFIPFPQRLLAILQLCIVFSLVLWYISQPFMGEYFSLRSRLLLYEYMMGTSDILKNKGGQEAKLERHQERFAQLSMPTKHSLLSHYHEIQTYAQRSIFVKIGDGIKRLFSDVPLLEQGWMFFTALIAILILLKVEGAKEAAWLVPIIVLFYCLHHQFQSPSSALPLDHILFPFESELIERDHSLTWIEQKQKLEVAWEDYLIIHWLPKNRQNQVRHLQIEESEFAFTLARLDLLQGQSLKKWLYPKPVPLSLWMLGLYFAWNLLFAYSMNRKSYPTVNLKMPIPAK